MTPDPLLEAVREAIADAETDDNVPWPERPRPEAVTQSLRDAGVEMGLREAALDVIRTTDAYRDAVNGIGHPGEDHDKALHFEPCALAPDGHLYDLTGDCAACGGAQYGTEDSVQKAMGLLRAAVGLPKKPWETETQEEWDAALAAARENKP
jgi:hypothetical protein